MSREMAVVKMGHMEGVRWSTVTSSKENKKSLMRLAQCGEKE